MRFAGRATDVNPVERGRMTAPYRGCYAAMPIRVVSSDFVKPPSRTPTEGTSGIQAVFAHVSCAYLTTSRERGNLQQQMTAQAAHTFARLGFVGRRDGRVDELETTVRCFARRRPHHDSCSPITSCTALGSAGIIRRAR